MFRIVYFFWPALIPLILYTLWYLWAKRRIEEGQNPLKWTDGPLIYAVMLTMGIVLLCFGFLIYANTAKTGEHYVPAHIENDKLVPSKIE